MENINDIQTLLERAKQMDVSLKRFGDGKQEKPEPNTRENEARISSTQIRASNTQACYRCGQNGHIARLCPTAPTPSAPPASVVVQPLGNQQQQQSLLGNAVSQGAFGGDRTNIGMANLMNQQNLAMGQTIGGMENQGYQAAAQNYMAGLGQQGALANQMGQLGAQQQAAALQGQQAVLGLHISRDLLPSRAPSLEPLLQYAFQLVRCKPNLVALLQGPGVYSLVAMGATPFGRSCPCHGQASGMK